MKYWANEMITRSGTKAILLFASVFFFASGECAAQGEALAAKSVFSFQNVVQEAKKLSGSDYKSPRGEVPDPLMAINYDQWRDIRFKPDRSFWKKEGLPFTLQFFHPGLYYDRTVAFYTITPKGEVKPIPFSKDLFTYRRQEVEPLVPDNLGFAGFRIHHPINTPDYHDEVAVFVGASYFRAVGQRMNYGLSARGLAIDTVLPSGEEFPYFRKFWIHEPLPDAKDITLYALLDSPSVAGAYRFVIHPGKETVMDVELTLFFRKPVAKLGIAPMTSMFHHGENSYAKVMDDFRPEIHDSDGLMIATATGEWIWRPLVNPKTLMINSFQVNNPVGFGLSQRDLDFDHYQDFESNYENRPSLWISPAGNWGEGRVELIQIPTDKEIYDNIVAFFVPSKLPEKGQSLSYAYRMIWHYATESPRPPAGRVVATRAASTKVEGGRKFVIDFAGPQLDSLPEDKPVEGVVTVGSGAKFMEQQVYKNRFTGGWRLVFQVLPDEALSADRDRPKAKEPVELRAFLKMGDNVLTETWSYAYEP
ncbi:MAG: glucan biosynthesis protein [Desulfobacterota bacterium]|nr:glucan biosynthesis protein [Thermodesulfobacteriota bacterium]